MAYLRIANLKKSYRISRTEKQQVLRGINVEFKRGEFVAVLGESGCGKSTFMNILGGLDQDYTGSIVLDGEFLKDYSEKKLDDYRKSRVGLIFQNYNLISHMSVRENIEVAMTMSNIDKGERKARTQEILAQVGLSDYADKFPNQLSGGQRQRVAIARASKHSRNIACRRTDGCTRQGFGGTNYPNFETNRRVGQTRYRGDAFAKSRFYMQSYSYN